MNGMITLGTYMVAIDTAYKTLVIGLLSLISCGVGYIVYWTAT